MQTNQTIEFNENVQPIKCSSEEVQEGDVAKLFGWGLMVSVEISHT